MSHHFVKVGRGFARSRRSPTGRTDHDRVAAMPRRTNHDRSGAPVEPLERAVERSTGGPSSWGPTSSCGPAADMADISTAGAACSGVSARERATDSNSAGFLVLQRRNPELSIRKRDWCSAQGAAGVNVQPRHSGEVVENSGLRAPANPVCTVSGLHCGAEPPSFLDFAGSRRVRIANVPGVYSARPGFFSGSATPALRCAHAQNAQNAQNAQRWFGSPWFGVVPHQAARGFSCASETPPPDRKIGKKTAEDNEASEKSASAKSAKTPILDGIENPSAPGIPTKTQLRGVFVAATIPFVGFGFLDNFLMILFGDAIDKTLCVAMGFSSMAAAALGNTISDVAGVFSGGVVEDWAQRAGIEMPPLTVEQLKMTPVKVYQYVGQAVGIVVGCILGMCPLLWYFFRVKSRGSSDYLVVLAGSSDYCIVTRAD